MATKARFRAQAAVAKDFANKTKELTALANRLLGHHFANSFGTAGDTPAPEYVQLDSEGNIDGQDFKPADYSNMANLADQFLKFINNEAPAQGDYKSSVEKVADA